MKKLLRWLDKVWLQAAWYIRLTSRRRKLRKICRVLDITPYPWQKAFILDPNARMEANEGRATGKTTAVMLKLAVREEFENSFHILCNDPDFVHLCGNSRCMEWYCNEYRRLQMRCRAAGFEVARTPWFKGEVY